MEGVRAQADCEVEEWIISTKVQDYKFTSDKVTIYWDDEGRILTVEWRDGSKHMYFPYEALNFVVRSTKK